MDWALYLGYSGFYLKFETQARGGYPRSLNRKRVCGRIAAEDIVGANLALYQKIIKMLEMRAKASDVDGRYEPTPRCVGQISHFFSRTFKSGAR
jgi:hypothetical protein